MVLVDVTDKVKEGWLDEETLEITRCVCGYDCGLLISIYAEDAHECPDCGRKLIFSVKTTVYEVVS